MNEQLNNTSNIEPQYWVELYWPRKRNLSKLFMWFHDKN